VRKTPPFTNPQTERANKFKKWLNVEAAIDG